MKTSKDIDFSKKVLVTQGFPSFLGIGLYKRIRSDRIMLSPYLYHIFCWIWSRLDNNRMRVISDYEFRSETGWIQTKNKQRYQINTRTKNYHCKQYERKYSELANRSKFHQCEDSNKVVYYPRDLSIYLSIYLSILLNCNLRSRW
jgi:hypothetical protein